MPVRLGRNGRSQLSRIKPAIEQGRGRPRRNRALYPARDIDLLIWITIRPVLHHASDHVRSRLGDRPMVGLQTLTLAI